MPTQPAAPNDPGQQAADTPFYRQILHDFINMGTDLARHLHQQAAAQSQPAPAPETLITITIAFDRLARAVRRSITLARSLAQPAAPARDPAHHRATARKRILREIEDAIQRTPGAEEADLQAELHDRLDAPDCEDDLATRPIPEIITEICRDLGLAHHPGTHPWKRRTPDDIQQLCAQAATLRRPQPGPAPQPGSPAIPHHAPANPAPSNPIPIGRPTIPQATTQTSNPPADPADLIARILHPPTHVQARWRPPPGA